MVNEKKKGQSLIIVLAVIIVLMIFMPVLVKLLRQETKWSVKQKRSTTAFHLAEAAVDRGIWKMRESVAVWDSAADGPITGYNNDIEYTDIEGGKYKISITTTTVPDERKIVGIGRDSSTKEVRAIEVILSAESIAAPIHAAGIYLKGHTEVHWGPIYSTDYIDLTGHDELWPRKYARSYINPRDTDSAEPNTDGVEWWSYNEPPGVPDVPEIDFDYYKAEAKSQGQYYATNQTFMGVVDTTTWVRYFEGNLRLLAFKNYLQGVLIVKGDFKATVLGGGTPTVDIPSEAWKEYAKIDTSDSDEYPGDIGYQKVAKTYTFSSINGVSIKGFLYVGGNCDVTSLTNIVGAIYAPNASASLAGWITVYYQDNMDIKTFNHVITRKSWKEINSDW